MEIENSEAKKLYFAYCCNTFFMQNNGDLEKYEKYRISKKQEKLWRKEFISEAITRLDIDDLSALKDLKDAGAIEALPRIIELSGKGDGYAKLRYAEAIWWIADIPWYSPKIRKEARNIVVDILENLIQKPFDITDQHKAQIAIYTNNHKMKTPEQFIVDYASRIMKDLTKRRFILF